MCASSPSGRDALVPEPVLGETCNFLRNNVPRGAAAETRFLRAMFDERGDFDIIDPHRKIAFAPPVGRSSGAAPVGYVDAMVIAIAERLRVPTSPR